MINVISAIHCCNYLFNDKSGKLFISAQHNLDHISPNTTNMFITILLLRHNLTNNTTV